MAAAPQIVVVGAGFAGLAAARELADTGCDVSVLEARDRVGGRVFTVRLENGEIAEMGAEWIMPGDSEVRRWASRFGVELAEAGIDYRRREARGPGAASLEDQDTFLAIAEEVFAALPPDELAALTVGRFLAALDAPDAGRASVEMRLQGTCAFDLDRIALRSMGGRDGLAPPAPAACHRMVPGNQALADAVAASLRDVRLEHRVRSIGHGAEGVVAGVEEGGDVTADAVVIAVPVRIAAHLDYDPFLPEDLALALRELPMGVASKLALPVGGEPAPRAVQSAELPFWSWVANGGGRGAPRRCVTAFAGSELAHEALGIARGDCEPWRDRTLALQPDLDVAGSATMKSWADDPLAYGSYSAWDNRSWDRMEELRRTVGRIAFAGEHTAGPQHHGTMEGALRSGVRAAAQVLEIIG